MKAFHYFFFFGFFVLLVSCAKDNLQTDNARRPAFPSITSLVESGFNVKNWHSKNINLHVIHPNPAITTRSTVFTTTPLDCPGLPVEDFEEGAAADVTAFPHPLNEFSNNAVFSPGDIIPGVSLNANNDRDDQELAFFPPGAGFGNSSKVVGATFFVDILILDFSAEGVRVVSMDVFDFISDGGMVTVEVFGISGSIGSTLVPSTTTGSYLGITTTEDIVQITLSSAGFGAEGVDNLSFGTCGSNINIDGCSPGVEDYEFEDGSTMTDLILECAENAGNHGGFVSCVSHLTNTWKKSGLITGEQKDAIMDCAGGADIP